MPDGSHELLADIVAAHGGELVGRIRLQKVIYLLDQLGLNSGFEYAYHHYGPYSSEVASALAEAQAARLIEDRPKLRQSDGAGYSVFYADAERTPDYIGSLDRDAVVTALSMMKSQPATVLELAATIHWLREVEKTPDWEAELMSRKGSKTGSGRKEQAVELLRTVDLFH